MQQAEKEDERGKAVFGDQWNSWNWAITSLHLGRHNHISSDEVTYPDIIFDVAKKHIGSPKKGLAELRRLYSDEGKTNSMVSAEIKLFSLWAAYFGDPDFAMDAMEKSIIGNIINAHYIWLPVYKGVRQTPRFKAFVKKIGLVDYWNKFGWPDICHKLDNGDFVCN